MAFDAAWSQLQNGYQEDFWAPLSIERFVVSEFPDRPELGSESPFTLAEEKAVKAVKVHGMTIGGTEKNSQMVAAYSLLGRARYFDQRFVPALEAFNYIIRRYPASNKLNEVRIWKEKTNLRLGNEAVALENIKRLLKFRKLKGQTLANAYAVRAQAYRTFNAIDSATWDLKRALKHTKRPIEKARYAYILGQFFQAQKQSDSALWAYEQVIQLNRRIPRIFLIQSKLQALFLKAKAGNTDKEAIAALSNMENNWENSPFLDRILFEKSQLLAARGKDSMAIVYAQKSLRANLADPKRNAENYRLIAQLYFDGAAYEKSAVYYDSLSQNLLKSSADSRRSIKKIEGLGQLLRFERDAQLTDSLLALAALSPSQQKTKVAQLISLAKKKDSILSQAILSQALQAAAKPNATEKNALSKKNKGSTAVNSSLSSSKGKIPAASGTQTAAQTQGNAGQAQGNATESAPSAIERPSAFYFYNAQAVASGKNAYQAVWGDRALADNWRWLITPKTPENSWVNNAANSQNKTPANSQNQNAATNQNNNAIGNQNNLGSKQGNAATAYEPKTPASWLALEKAYLAGIPNSKNTLDSLAQKGAQAYFQLGLLYKNNFNRPDLALTRLKPLYQKPPEAALLPAVAFALYETYKALGSYQAEPLKTRILTDFPESDFATAIKNPAFLATRRAQLEVQYDSIYQRYKAQDFTAVLAGTTQILSNLQADPKAAPTALLQANTLGRLYGLAAYKSALKKLTANYPNTQVATAAQKSLQSFEDNPPSATFSAQEKTGSWYLALLFSGPYQPTQDSLYQKTFQQRFPTYKIQREVYAPSKTFYVISGFETKAAATAMKATEFFKENKLSDQAFFVILGSHYKTLQLFKNLKAYQLFTAKDNEEAVAPKK